jgi:predicted glycosyltransferase
MQLSHAHGQCVLSLSVQQKLLFHSTILKRSFDSWTRIQKRDRLNIFLVVAPHEVKEKTHAERIKATVITPSAAKSSHNLRVETIFQIVSLYFT